MYLVRFYRADGKPDEEYYDEYAGCMVLTDKQTIAFKVDYMSDLIKAMETMPKE